MQKESKVVMLPTEKATNVYLDIYSNLHYTENENRPVNFQYLYFLSDDEIKEGDWCFYLGKFGAKIVCKAKLTSIGFVYQEIGEEYKDREDEGITPLKSEIFKIIATTDESLKYQYSENHPLDLICLPRLSNEFLKKYCELGGIDKVLVEYEHFDELGNYIDESFHSKTDVWKLKVAPDNTITIYPI